MEFGQGIYDEDFSARTYDEMLRLAEAHLAAGQSLILDGSYKRGAERARVRRLAQDQGARVVFVYCECPPRWPGSAWESGSPTPRPSPTAGWSCSRTRLRDFDPFRPEDRPLLRLDTTRDPEVVLEELLSFVRCFQNAGDPDDP